MDPSEITITHIIFSCICVIFIIISISNALQFIIFKENKLSIYEDDNLFRVVFHLVEYVCAWQATLMAIVIAILYILTVCGYYTPLIDIIANAGG